jgi:folate-binding protein YgfZ
MKPTNPDHPLLALRQAGGYACALDFGLIVVSGPEAGKFLQSRTTNDVAALQSGQGQLSCLLDRKAHIEACFSLHRLDDEFWIVAERAQISEIFGQLDKFLFNTKAEVVDRSDQGQFATVQGYLARKLLAKGSRVDILLQAGRFCIARIDLWSCPTVLIERSLTGEDGYLVWCNTADGRQLRSELRQSAAELSLVELSNEALNMARIEAGLPLYGTDMSLDNLLPETGLEAQSVSYTKGCYLGQEVIARIKTYGAPRRGLCGLRFAEGANLSFPVGAAIFLDGKEIGSLQSNVYSPFLERTIALAYLNKEHRVPGERISIAVSGTTYPVEVTLLPIYEPPTIKERVRGLYEEALAEFATGDETKSITLLRDALILDPLHADCYESLGVILSRQERLEEAVSVMKKLAELDPNSVMAHANLSVFYMQLGNKEAAEEEKAVAMSIRMQQIAREVDHKRKDAETQKEKREATLARMEMFRQVLAIDSEDLLANAGLGSIHVELEEYEQAIPFLVKSIQVKPTHSMSYLALGAAYAGMDRLDEATTTYRQGIEVAAKRGDMMPLKEMQLQLAKVEQLKACH